MCRRIDIRVPTRNAYAVESTREHTRALVQVVTNQGTANVAVYRASLSGNGAAPFFATPLAAFSNNTFFPLKAAIRRTAPTFLLPEQN